MTTDTARPARSVLRRRELAAIERAEHHGEPHQLNHYVRDVDSDVTDYGRHNRLVVFGPSVTQPDPDGRNVVTIREDVHGLPMSTEEDRLRAANGWQRMHPARTRLVHESSTPYTGNLGECIEHVYRWTPAAVPFHP